MSMHSGRGRNQQDGPFTSLKKSTWTSIFQKFFFARCFGIVKVRGK
jgi:hypothetical protein